MKNILLIMAVFLIVSCGSDDSSTDTDVIKNKKSKVLAKIKNTYWEMPTYKYGNIRIKDDTATSSMSETSFISNGTISMLDEDDNFTVFNVYNAEKNTVFGLSLVDKDTIKVSVISASNSLEGYKSNHDVLGVIMKKK